MTEVGSVLWLGPSTLVGSETGPRTSLLHQTRVNVVVWSEATD
jgi:hypothetical protein